MAEFLTTKGVAHRLEQIIMNAHEWLLIISPYLKMHQRIKALLEDRARREIPIVVVYGKKELQPEEKDWLRAISIRTKYLQHLHAKCYLNENEALLTSMNLYEFSEVNNHEMGIVVSREQETDLYRSIYDEAGRIIRAGVASEEDMGGSGKNVPREIHGDAPEEGFCIRCGSGLPASPLRPYCKRCYKAWKQMEDPEYEDVETYCHICGSEHAATLLKPACRSCYGKYKDVLEFAA